MISFTRAESVSILNCVQDRMTGGFKQKRNLWQVKAGISHGNFWRLQELGLEPENEDEGRVPTTTPHRGECGTTARPDAWFLWLTQDLDAFSHRSFGTSAAAPTSTFLPGQHTHPELAAILASGKQLFLVGGIGMADVTLGSAQDSLTL